MTGVSRDFKSEVVELSSQIDSRRDEQARAEARAAAAQEELNRLLEKLKTEFGVESIDAARSLLADLESRLSQEIGDIRSQLSEIGVSL
jgi:hypothetical protein